MMDYRILAINPGSTSTKISIYDNYEQKLYKHIDYNKEKLSKYKHIYDQHEKRRNDILNLLKENNVDLKSIDAIVGRGGLLPPLRSGAYIVDEKMIDILRYNPILEHASNLGGIIAYEIANTLNINAYIYDPVSVDEFSEKMIDILRYNPILEHASNLGGIIAYEIANTLNINAYIYDPVSVDEFSDIARVSGIEGIERISLSHALNSRAMAIKYCKNNNIEYKNVNLIVAHLGGGISLSINYTYE